MDHNYDTWSDQGHDWDNKTYVSALSTIRYMLKRWLRQLSLHQWCASHATTSQVGTCRGFYQTTPIRALSSIEPPTDHCQDDISERIEYFYQAFVTTFQRSSFQETGLQVYATTPSQLVMKLLIHMKLDFHHSRHTAQIDKTSKCEESSYWTHT